MAPPLDHPRPHHYQFAHKLLPQVLLSPATGVRDLARTGRLTRALVTSWADIGRTLAESDRLAPDGLAGDLVTEDGMEAVLITLPPPIGPTEAYFAAVAPCEPATGRRYFVLERSVSMDDHSVTVLGEWTRRAHLNLGRGPNPVPQAFLTTVRAVAGPPTAAPRRGLFGRFGRDRHAP